MGVDSERPAFAGVVSEHLVSPTGHGGRAGAALWDTCLVPEGAIEYHTREVSIDVALWENGYLQMLSPEAGRMCPT